MSPWDAAFAAARAAAARGEVPVGAAVAAPDGTLLAVAGNEVMARNDPSAHAEILALRRAGAVLKQDRLVHCDIYITLEPCTMCAAAISFARVRRLYYAAADLKAGAVDNGVRFFQSPTCHHVPEVYGGFRESEARALLQEFFAVRR